MTILVKALNNLPIAVKIPMGIAVIIIGMAKQVEMIKKKDTEKTVIAIKEMIYAEETITQTKEIE